MTVERPLILIADPEPRVLETVFDAALIGGLGRLGEVLIHAGDRRLPGPELEAALARASVVIGQIDLPRERLERMERLRAVINIEGNFARNLDYAACFERGVHVLVASPVFAEPVAEIALGMAIDLARGVTAAHEAFRTGTETWGMPPASERPFSLYDAPVGIIGLGDLGLALRRLLGPFRCPVAVFDPWLTPSRIAAQECRPATLEEVLAASRVTFVFAGATADNEGFLDGPKLDLIPQGGVLLLMSRANVIDFDALAGRIAAGRLRAGIDVFPAEPLAPGHPLRRMGNCLLSSHRAGSLPEVFRRMGRIVAEDVGLILRGLPPANCKRAERETVGRLRSKPISLAMQDRAAG